jgi:hypothetical protein
MRRRVSMGNRSGKYVGEDRRVMLRRENDEVRVCVRGDDGRCIAIDLSLDEAKNLAERIEKLSVMRCFSCRRNIEDAQFHGYCLACWGPDWVHDD